MRLAVHAALAELPEDQRAAEVGAHSIVVAEVLPGGTLAADARLFEVGTLGG